MKIVTSIKSTYYLFTVSICGSLLFCQQSFAQAENVLTKAKIAEAVTDNARKNLFPNKLMFETSDGDSVEGYVRYTFDQKVHQDMAKVYLQYQPDYACFVAIDVETGAILNLTSFVKSGEEWDNLVMRSEYPAASVFKMVTAAAGIDLGKINSKTVIPYNGKSTTLYKNQVFDHKDNKWTREPTLKESFAKSINPVFAQLGVYYLGQENLTNYAHRFGFDRPLKSDFELPESHIRLDLSTDWALAEAASGYTRDITLSPIHAAQMAATVANDGKMVVPYMVESVASPNGQLLYQAQSNSSPEQVISASSAAQLRSLMTETTRIGSARSSFSGLSKYKVYKDMEIGGKTGSLTGLSPKGRHDWFVGYAEKDGRKVAYASLIVNVDKWYVRSAYVARQFIYHYFTDIQKAQELTAAAELEKELAKTENSADE
ncbi:penicillin-binding transpeptidase domain-containing protein [Arenicella sp.]|nr:penicillin-binding transpeptidase domain-containing protein [Arenicella sp.]